MTNQNLSSLVYRIIILGCLSCLASVIVSQDLEEGVKEPFQRTMVDDVNSTNPTSSDGRIFQSLGEELDSLTFGRPLTSEQSRTSGQMSNHMEMRSPDTYKKEEYLNKLLRLSYYQKMTTPRWSKYLHQKSWKNNVLKWRYWSHLKKYITGNNMEVLVIRTPQSNIEDTLSFEKINSIEDSALVLGSDESIVDSSLIDGVEDIPAVDVIASADSKTDVDTGQEGIRKDDISDHLADEPFEEVAIKEVLFVYDTAPWIVKKGTDIAISENDQILKKEEPSKEKPVISTPTTEVATITDPISTTHPAIENSNLGNPQDTRELTPIVKTEMRKPVNPPVTTIVQSPITNYKASRRTQNLNFLNLKGAMPWPVTGGRVTSKFGIRENAKARGLRPENHGIDMICSGGAVVTAVHNGTILMAKRQSPYDYIVTIKHGDYTTAYYYLITPYVKSGDVVYAGQRIGQLRTSVAEADFHFEVWNNQDRLNPLLWLKVR